MALEDLTGTKFTDSLVETNPPQTDFRYEGAGHVRGIKNVLKQTWANITGAVTATQADLDKTKLFPTVTAGDALKGLRVNAAETAYEFVADIGASTANITEWTCTAGQTTFSGTDDNAVTLEYSPGYLQVYLNGILLEDTTDYVATNGTSIVLNTGASLSDVLQAFGFGTFDLADHYTKTQADANKYDKTETYSQTESDAAFAPITRSRKNMLINGNFGVFERPASFTRAPISSTEFSADRWKCYMSHDGAVTVGGAAAPANVPSRYYMYWTITTADASLAATQYFVMENRIEGIDVAHLKWGTANAATVTISFLHAHTKTGTHSITLRNADNTRAYIAEYTQSVSNAWEAAEITIPGCTDGTWSADEEAVGISLLLCAAVGSTYQATAGSWVTGTYLGSTNQVNNLDTIGNYMKFTNVQLEVGSEATDYEYRSRAEELELCRRYYVKIVKQHACAGAYSQTTNARVFVPLGTPMCSGAPTLEHTLSDWRIRGGTNVTPSAASVNTSSNANTSGISIDFTVAAATQYAPCTGYNNNDFSFDSEI